MPPQQVPTRGDRTAQAEKASHAGLQSTRISTSALASSGDAKQAKAWAMVGRATSSWLDTTARALVCLYFFNTVWSSLGMWQYTQELQHTERLPHAYSPAK